VPKLLMNLIPKHMRHY